MAADAGEESSHSFASEAPERADVSRPVHARRGHTPPVTHPAHPSRPLDGKARAGSLKSMLQHPHALARGPEARQERQEGSPARLGAGRDAGLGAAARAALAVGEEARHQPSIHRRAPSASVRI